MDFVRYGIYLAQITQRAQRRVVDCGAPMNVNHFLLHLSYHHALHGGAAVRRSVLRLDCVSTISYFILHFILPTSYFLLQLGCPGRADRYRVGGHGLDDGSRLGQAGTIGRSRNSSFGNRCTRLGGTYGKPSGSAS